MQTTHAILRYMALRLADDQSHFTAEDLRVDPKQEYEAKQGELKALVREACDQDKAERIMEAAAMMAYAYGDYYAEEGIKQGICFAIETLTSATIKTGQ